MNADDRATAETRAILARAQHNLLGIVGRGASSEAHRAALAAVNRASDRLRPAQESQP